MYLLMEFTYPKDEERNKKRLKHEVDWMYPYYEKKIKEGVKWKGLGLSDGTGRIVSLTTFETVKTLVRYGTMTNTRKEWSNCPIW